MADPVLVSDVLPVNALLAEVRVIEPFVAPNEASPPEVIDVLAAWARLPTEVKLTFPPTVTLPRVRPLLLTSRVSSVPALVIVTVPLKALPALVSVRLPVAFSEAVEPAVMPATWVRSTLAVSESGPVTLTAPIARLPV